MTAPPSEDVLGLLAGPAAAPSAPALTFYAGRHMKGRLSYAELTARVESLASVLTHRFGVREGDRIAVLSANRLEVPVLVLAALRIGAVLVPLNPTASLDDWAHILAHSGARGLFATRDVRDKLPNAPALAFVAWIDELFDLESSASAPPARALADHPGIVLYTSGTTGQPKGVVLSQRSLVANAWSMAKHFRIRQATQLAVLPLYHAHAFGFGLMTALSTGGHLVFAERFDPLSWAYVARIEKATVASVVPTMLPMLTAGGVRAGELPVLKHFLVSSAPLSQTAARQFEAATGLPIVLGWGLSEYTNFACCAPTGEAADRDRQMYGEDVPSVGPSLEGTEVRVVRSDGEPADEGERGELQVRGHSTMIGYFDDPRATADAVDPEGWLRTGDEGFYRAARAASLFFVSGRLKEIIIRDAEKFSPVRIEASLLGAVPALTGKVVVVGFPHEDHGEEVGGYIETEAIGEALRGALAAALARMPLAERPKILLFGTRSVPRTHTGKVQRRKMQAWFEAWRRYRGVPILVGPVDDIDGAASASPRIPLATTRLTA